MNLIRKCILLFVVFVISITTSFAQNKKPNFLIIVADDLGFSDIGCYGSEIKTPTLDSLAQNGMRFTNFYNTARCWTTRSSLMCGYYHDQLGVDRKGIDYKKPTYVTWARAIPEMLQPMGYKSYMSGKWHVPPIDRVCKDAKFDRAYRLDDPDRNFNPTHHSLDDKNLPAVKKDSGYYSTVNITDYMIEFLKEHDENHPDKPFFAYLTYIVPHFPLHALPEDIKLYEGKYSHGWNKNREARFARLKDLGFPEYNLSTPESKLPTPSDNKGLKVLKDVFGEKEVTSAVDWDALSDDQKIFQAKKMEIHAAAITRMDMEIGRIVNQLKEMGVLDDTIIIFLSDNGASAEMMVRGDGHKDGAEFGSADSYLCLGPGWANSSNTPFRRYKIWTHEGGISTPFIISWGNGIDKNLRGKFNESKSHVIDIMPTLLFLAGSDSTKATESAPYFPGKDLTTAIKHGKKIDRDFIYFNHSGNNSIIAGDWKATRSTFMTGDRKWRLYNISSDRAEENDLSDSHPDKLTTLIQKWESLQKQYSIDNGF